MCLSGGNNRVKGSVQKNKGIDTEQETEIGSQKWVSEVESVAQSVKELGVSKGEVKNMCGEH